MDMLNNNTKPPQSSQKSTYQCSSNSIRRSSLELISTNQELYKSNRDSLRLDLTDQKANYIFQTFMSHLGQLKEEVKENSKALHSVLYNTIHSKTNQLNIDKLELTSEITELKSSAKDLIHQVAIPNNTTSGLILNNLNSNRKKYNFDVRTSQININKIREKIQTSNIKIKKSIKDLENEPKFFYFVPGPEFTVNQFNIFSKSFNVIFTENASDWPKKGNFIEYIENLFLYAGEVSFFSRKGLWHFDLSEKIVYPMLIFDFPGREDHTLEYFNSSLYVIGGSSKKIKYVSLDTGAELAWKEFGCCLDSEIGYSHSALIEETVYLVGAKSRFLTKLNLVKNCIENEYFEFFEESFNKFVFNVDESQVVLANKKILYKGMVREIHEDFSRVKSPGKGKIVYSYLYFVGYDEDFKEEVWRLCLNSFRLDKFCSRFSCY